MILNDVETITSLVFKEALQDKKILKNPKRVYDLYRNLNEVIDSAKLVANHYLALDFSEDYLQNSSWGEPIDKWRKFLNKDLEELNDSVKKYLLTISNIGFENDLGSIIGRYYNLKVYYGFVRDFYNVGFIEPCGSSLIATILDVKNLDNKNYYIENFYKADLTSFESKLQLQKELNEKILQLTDELQKLKVYLQTYFTLEDLL